MTNEYQTEINALEAIIEKVTERKISDFDTFLAYNTDNREPSQKDLTLYSAIGAACEQLDHKLFVPARVIKTEEYGELTFRDAFAVCNSIMIPKTKFFLCDLTTPTRSVIEMIHKARELKKPQVYFYNQEIVKILNPSVERYAKSLKDNNPDFKAEMGYVDVVNFMRMLRQVIKYNFK